MGRPPERFVSWKEWTLGLMAVGAGASLSLYREDRDTGRVSTGSLLISGIGLLIGITIITSIFRYADKPGPKDDE